MSIGVSAEVLIDKIKKTRNPVKRTRLALEFFAKKNTYVRSPIG